MGNIMWCILVLDSPDDGRGSSPSRSNPLGRRGSYKTSRGESNIRLGSQVGDYEHHERMHCEVVVIPMVRCNWVPRSQEADPLIL